jgi:CheY-specific phosphatase CheX
MSAVLSAQPLGEVTKLVLGTAAFLFCDDVPPGTGPVEGRLAEAVIGFTGPRDGRITLRMPWEVALEAAANLLGVEKDDPDAQESALAAVGELLNMISGSVLKEWFGAGAEWALGVPATSERAGRLPSVAPQGEVVGFVVDEARIEVEAAETGG